MWTENNQKLCKTWSFPDFSNALAFVVQVGILAEKMDHHPRIVLDYGSVYLELTTHSAGNQITEKDRELAYGIDLLAPNPI